MVNFIPPTLEGGHLIPELRGALGRAHFPRKQVLNVHPQRQSTEPSEPQNPCPGTEEVSPFTLKTLPCHRTQSKVEC